MKYSLIILTVNAGLCCSKKTHWLGNQDEILAQNNLTRVDSIEDLLKNTNSSSLNENTLEITSESSVDKSQESATVYGARPGNKKLNYTEQGNELVKLVMKDPEVSHNYKPGFIISRVAHFNWNYSHYQELKPQNSKLRIPKLLKIYAFRSGKPNIIYPIANEWPGHVVSLDWDTSIYQQRFDVPNIIAAYDYHLMIEDISSSNITMSPFSMPFFMYFTSILPEDGCGSACKLLYQSEASSYYISVYKTTLMMLILWLIV